CFGYFYLVFWIESKTPKLLIHLCKFFDWIGFPISKRYESIASKATNVIAHRPKAKCTIGDKYAANRNSIAYVHIRCDADKFDTWKLGGVDDLLINIILDLLQELRSQEQAHRDINCLCGCKCVVSILV